MITINNLEVSGAQIGKGLCNKMLKAAYLTSSRKEIN